MPHDPTLQARRRTIARSAGRLLLALAAGSAMQPALGQVGAWPTQKPITLIGITRKSS